MSTMVKPDSGVITLQDAAVATGNGAALPVNEMGAVGIQITGITTATITFEGTIDGTNWVSVYAQNVATNAIGTTATANGIYVLNVMGLAQIRARISAWTSGTIYVTAHRIALASALNVAAVTLGALAAGSAIIGKVGVDQTTEGTTNRVVSGKAAVVDTTPTLDTSAYSAGDVLFTGTAITGAARASGLGTTLCGVTLVDKDDEGAAITLYFFDSAPSFGTINGAPSISDANAAKCLGIVDIATGDYDDLGGVKVAHVRGFALPMLPSGSADLYVAAVCTGTPTYTSASDIVLRCHFLQD